MVDPVQERMRFETWPDPSIEAVNEGLDYMEVVGLTKNYKLTESEWADLMAEEASEKHTLQANREMPYLQLSRAVIAKKQQLVPGRNLLQGKPLAVLMGNSSRDLELLYKAGVDKGQGTEAQRAKFRAYLEQWDQTEEDCQRELLHLSTTTRFSTATRSGHNIQITEPERIAEEIRWVIQNLQGPQSDLTQ
jgi:hypothetical protein